jgi:hypothetical protein
MLSRLIFFILVVIFFSSALFWGSFHPEYSLYPTQLFYEHSRDEIAYFFPATMLFTGLALIILVAKFYEDRNFRRAIGLSELPRNTIYYVDDWKSMPEEKKTCYYLIKAETNQYCIVHTHIDLPHHFEKQEFYLESDKDDGFIIMAKNPSGYWKEHVIPESHTPNDDYF